MKITVDVRPLNQAADRLERVASRARFALATVEAVNAVTRRADESLRRGETQDINLSPAYVKSKTDVRLAGPGEKPTATITTKGDLTILGRFAPLSDIPGRGAMRRAGPVPGFRRAGVFVNIRKSQQTFEPQWFIMRLRRGTAPGDAFGVFVRDDSLPGKNGPNPALAGGRHRDGKAGKRHLYGPSPYQLFRKQIGVQADDIRDDLRRSALAEIGDVVRGALR